MSRRRRRLVLALLAIVAGLADGAVAQTPTRVWRVGFLWPRSHLGPPASDYYDEVEKGLRDLGYVEGKNLLVERRYADGRYDRLPALAAELVQLKVDVIVTDGTPSTLAAQKATRTIPIIFGSAGDPVGNGLVKSLARPGGNTTGISLLANDVSAKQIEMLTRMVPKLSRMAALLNPTNPYSLAVLKGLQTAAESVKVAILPVEARSPQEIEGAFSTMRRERVGAFIWVPDAVLTQQRRQIAELAAAHGLPGMGPAVYMDVPGALMAYGANQANNYHRVATYVDKIFKGANPGDLPVEQPTKLELVINRKAAKALGLEIPPEILVQADKVIE